jgi:hypothetical protein
MVFIFKLGLDDVKVIKLFLCTAVKTFTNLPDFIESRRCSQFHILYLYCRSKGFRKLLDLLIMKGILN